MSSQSAVLDARGRGRYKFDRFRYASSEVFLTNLPFHLGQDRSAIAATKNKRLAHERGRFFSSNTSAFSRRDEPVNHATLQAGILVTAGFCRSTKIAR